MATVEVDALKTEITNLETNIKSSVADKFTTSMVESVDSTATVSL